MDSAMFPVLLTVFLVTLFQVTCCENIGPVIDSVNDLDHQLVRVRKDMTEFEERVLNKLDIAKLSLRSELKDDLNQHVRDAMVDVLEGEPIEEMLQSQIVSEVRQLQKENQEIKKTLRDIQRENKLYREGLIKSERQVKELRSCSKYVHEVQVIQGKVDQCKDEVTRKNIEIQELEQRVFTLNETFKTQIDMTTIVNNCSQNATEYQILQTELLKSRIEISVKEMEIQELRHKMSLLNETRYQDSEDMDSGNLQSVITTESTTSSTTSVTTTEKPEEVKNRILIAPLWTQTPHQFLEVSMHNNSFLETKHNIFEHVTSMVYVPKIHRLLVCLFHPNRIVSTNLEGYDVQPVVENVCNYDMTVDERLDIVVMATCEPNYTISKMSIDGQGYHVLRDFTEYGKPVSAVAVNPEKKEIFACSTHKLFMISYEGEILQIFNTGKGALAMTLDFGGTALYYGDAMKMMKVDLSQNVTSEVTTLGVIPWKFRYYNNTVYYSTTGSSTGYIGAVDLEGGETRTLQTVKMTGSSTYAICLLP